MEKNSLIQQIWNDVLPILENTIIKTTYDTWIVPLVPHSFEDNCFCVLSGQNLAVQIIQKHHKQISKALSDICKQEVNFKVVYDEELHKQLEKEKQKAKKEEQKEFIKNLENRITSSRYDGLKQMRSDCNLNLKYKFDNFVVGANNKFAHAVAVAVRDAAGTDKSADPSDGTQGCGRSPLR